MPKAIDMSKDFKMGSSRNVPRNAETLMSSEICQYTAARAMYIISLFFEKHNILYLSKALGAIEDEKKRDDLRQFLKDIENQAWAFDRAFQSSHGVKLIEKQRA